MSNSKARLTEANSYRSFAWEFIIYLCKTVSSQGAEAETLTWNITLHLKKGICFLLFVGSQKHLSVIMHFHYFKEAKDRRKHPQKTKLPESVVGSSAISKN